MKNARYRALTHRNHPRLKERYSCRNEERPIQGIDTILHHLMVTMDPRRNEERPIQGIDTMFLFGKHTTFILVEMKKARYRALTQGISVWPMFSYMGRNEESPI